MTVLESSALVLLSSRYFGFLDGRVETRSGSSFLEGGVTVTPMGEAVGMVEGTEARVVWTTSPGSRGCLARMLGVVDVEESRGSLEPLVLGMTMGLAFGCGRVTAGGVAWVPVLVEVLLPGRMIWTKTGALLLAALVLVPTLVRDLVTEI